MHILIIGAAGMVGCKLAQSILATGTLGSHPVGQMDCVDIIPPSLAAANGVEVHNQTLDLSDANSCKEIIAREPDLIVHLAAIVSGESERDFDKGYRINLDGTRYLLEAIRALHDAVGYAPKFLFSSSIAVYGTPFPEAIGDEFLLAPLGSYGTQKAMSELLINDYTRKGFIDGLSMRLPTVCVRPGKANLAASSFFSNIIREPLAGKEVVLPVSDKTRHWHISPRRVVGFFHDAVDLDLNRVGPRRALNMPGLSVTVAEQIEALVKVAGQDITKLIKEKPDQAVRALVETWPENFYAKRASDLGFKADASFDEIIAVHIEDELGGKI